MIASKLTLALISLLAASTLAAPHRSHAKRQSKYPFSRVVAFGDNLSDNGNGSYAHHVQDAQNPDTKIYGYGTWTDGPVAVSYLVSMLGVPLSWDFAFGHFDGGSKVGATINNAYTYSEAPDGFSQVANYSNNAAARQDIENTLHFLWIGNNDINIAHMNTFGAEDETNQKFAEYMSGQFVQLVGKLVDMGAQHIMVPSLYAKHIAPVTKRYYGIDTEQHVQAFGAAIHAANVRIRNALWSAYGTDKIIWYPAFVRMEQLWADAHSMGITQGDTMCDGSGSEAWQACMMDGKGGEFYWMQYLDMTTRVHQLLAEDMFANINAHYGV